MTRGMMRLRGLKNHRRKAVGIRWIIEWRNGVVARRGHHNLLTLSSRMPPPDPRDRARKLSTDLQR